MSTKVKIRRPYDPSVRTSIKFPNQTMAKQSFRDETNINIIMAKYQKTGLIEHVQKVQGSYGDFTSVQDYQLSLNQVIEAQEAFDQLPAKIRKRFHNDPSHLMSFLQDKNNLDEAIALGLVEPSPDPQPKEPAKGSSEPPGGEATSDQQAKPAPPNKGP